MINCVFPVDKNQSQDVYVFNFKYINKIDYSNNPDPDIFLS